MPKYGKWLDILIDSAPFLKVASRSIIIIILYNNVPVGKGSAREWQCRRMAV